MIKEIEKVLEPTTPKKKPSMTIGRPTSNRKKNRGNEGGTLGDRKN
jgi:hypothetical protein